MIKLFASDLDGTLFNALHETDRAILTRLEAVLRAGRHVALATGRAVHHARELGFGNLPLETVSGNGAFIRDTRGELLRHVPIAPATLEELLAGFPRCCLSCIDPELTLVRGSHEQFVASFRPSRGLAGRLAAWRQRRRPTPPDQLFDQTDAAVLARPICKVNCRTADPDEKRELAAFVAEHADTIVNASFDGDLFELTDARVNKGEALSWLAARLGFGEDEVAVYGDGGNDLAMLVRFDHAYATSNASDAAKRAAGHVIGSCALHAVPRHMLATVRREGPWREEPRG
ncbi:HAD family phosphatase [Olsenella profusa]|uniref:HAD family phosphatase n=1 Tax=Olsenella profusa TaxID=138595 RepID=A0ABS2F4B5_9ACTN|nr:HAD family hydrolase [Olsenella profusa]MBM6775403.1 HAD family phosphatase [Olsenella profusa]